MCVFVYVCMCLTIGLQNMHFLFTIYQQLVVKKLSCQYQEKVTMQLNFLTRKTNH